MVGGGGGGGGHKLTWKKLTEKDCHEWKVRTVDPGTPGDQL